MDLEAFSDAQLMVLFAHSQREHQRGEDASNAAFAALFSRHHQRVYRIACRMCGSNAEDVVQEVFLRVARAAPRYEPRAAFTT